ncbi:tRNA(Glu)-specific nuclease WapA precursor [Polystyrenella longa]|uniref:tRNA(Glu)-specific nuclease WapA n=1 Tax=Polystyrenella longa TaxID=2528007 RepID=A0A518CTE3_9PLAN|nr:RHS repeat-associated core domain-containing protein [Polystyrenella longa]QDU82488.1 tRNA(Glu)-specific nuclease WapA precursor [Polystyrenella longa]
MYEYDYDVYGNMTQITDPLDRETDFTFNAQNQQLTRTLPVTGDEQSWYDDEDRQYRSEDFEGNVMDRLFTDEGLLDELQYFNSSADPDVDTPDETVSYTYDDQYRKTSMTDDRGTTYYTYDDDGRITRISSPEGILNYEYDDLTGLKTRVTTGDPSDVENDFRYTYDSLNRLKTVEVHERNDSALSTPEVTTYSYDAVGNLVRTDLANGLITTYEYDDLYRLDVLTHYEPDSTPNDLSDNDKLASYDYTVRADGKRTAATETRWDNGTPLVDAFSWTYDDLGRLITEVFDSHDNALDFEANYTYDLVGNRLKKTVDQDLDLDIDETYTYTYNDSDQLLTETKVVGNVDDGTNLETDDTTTTYSYTNTLQTGKEVKATYANTVLTDTSFDYNLQGRLETVTIDTYTSGSISGQEITTFEYDDRGIRVSAHHAVDSDYDSNLEVDETTTYLNDPMNHTGYSQVIEEVTVDNLNSQAETERVIYTLGLDVLQQVKYDSANPTGLNSIMLHDGHGSVRMLTNMLAAVTVVNSIPQIFTYDAYGIAIGFNEATAVTSMLYSGEQFDTRIQQQYLRARYYNADTGGFNRLDPFFGNLRDPQSLHKYLYTHGDPVNGIDPTGMFSLTNFLITTSLISGLASILIPAVGNAYNHSVSTLNNAEQNGIITSVFKGTVTRDQISRAWKGFRDGAMAGYLNLLDTFTFRSIDNLHEARDFYWNHTGLNNSWLGTATNSLAWISTISGYAAAAVWTWNAAGGGTMDLALSRSGKPFFLHVKYGANGQWQHAVATSESGFGALGRMQIYNTWTPSSGLITGIPVLFPQSVIVGGESGFAFSCVTAAARAFFRGWGF